MKSCYIVFYTTGSLEEISSFNIFPDVESVYKDIELFYKSFPTGSAFPILIFLSSDSDYEKLVRNFTFYGRNN